jgi:tetratricopeptide (TPR) repeat protein
MRFIRLSALVFAGSVTLGFFTAPPARAQSHAEQQQLALPQVSPHAVVQQTVGLTEVVLDYHSPSVRNRAIWGSLVPYDQVWRAGANENTIISFADPVVLNGQAVPAGRYSYYVVPHETRDWEVVLNRVTTHWGAEGYDAKDDQLRLTASPESAAMHENLLFWFSELKPASARLNLTWEKRTVSVLVETDVHTKVLATIEQTIAAQPQNWQLLAQAADYLVQNNLESELALRYINESIRLKEAYTNTWIKARLLASKQDYDTAIVYGRKAIKLGEKQDTNFKTQLPNMRLALTEWQSKAY